MVYPVSTSDDFLPGEDSSSHQVGLRLPNGDVLWPPDEYKGFPIGTSEERTNLLKVLKKSAGDLSFDVEDFLLHYRWVTREVITTVVAGSTREISIEDPLAFDDTENSTGKSHFDAAHV